MLRPRPAPGGHSPPCDTVMGPMVTRDVLQMVAQQIMPPLCQGHRPARVQRLRRQGGRCVLGRLASQELLPLLKHRPNVHAAGRPISATSGLMMPCTYACTHGMLTPPSDAAWRWWCDLALAGEALPPNGGACGPSLGSKHALGCTWCRHVQHAFEEVRVVSVHGGPDRVWAGAGGGCHQCHHLPPPAPHCNTAACTIACMFSSAGMLQAQQTGVRGDGWMARRNSSFWHHGCRRQCHHAPALASRARSACTRPPVNAFLQVR